MIERIKVIGLQRSGTNWIEQLIRLNMDIIVYDDPIVPFFKHALPNEYEIQAYREGKMVNTFIPVDYIDSHPKELFILVKKPVDKWIISIRKNHADLQMKHPEIFPEGINGNYNLLQRYYRVYHNYWQSIPHDNLLIVNYIDVLEDIDFLADTLLRKYGLKSKNDVWQNITKVPHSKKFTNEDRKRYLA